MSSKADLARKRAFYENRKKELLAKKALVATQHVYDEEGNLVTKNKDGSVDHVITLPSYVPPSMEDLEAMEAVRKQNIETASKAYDDAFDALHREYQRPDRSDAKIVQFTQLVMQADHQLQYARYPVRYVRKEEGVEIRKIDFKQPSEKRKLPYDIARLERSPFPVQHLYVRTGPSASVPAVGSLFASSSEPILFIQDSDTNEYGFMALDWAVQLTVGGATYHSAKQALVAERAKAMGDNELYQQAMDARTPAEVPRLSRKNAELDEKYADEPSRPMTDMEWQNLTKQLLYDIHRVKFQSYPELKARLFETKQAILAAYVPNDTLLGIGLPIGDLRAKSPVHWTGQNLLGTVLMDLRKKLREEEEKKEEEAKEAKKKPRKPVSTAVVPISRASPSASLVPSAPASSAASLVPASASASLVPASSIVPAASLIPASTVPASLVPKKKPSLSLEARAQMEAKKASLSAPASSAPAAPASSSASLLPASAPPASSSASLVPASASTSLVPAVSLAPAASLVPKKKPSLSAEARAQMEAKKASLAPASLAP